MADRELAEKQRLREDAARQKNWKRWGPYLAERQWATVREDYSEFGTCWDYFSHQSAISRAYRWGEDGLLGMTDRECRLCFAWALWNGRDRILKERLFGLTGPQGNHGEDVKEAYFYLDSTPTHSYLKALYKFPLNAFPYEQLIEENQRRDRDQREWEIEESNAFERYADVLAEYAKASPDDILARLQITNRGHESAEIHVLPTIWFRNTWTWGCTHEGCTIKPRIQIERPGRLRLHHVTLGTCFFDYAPLDSAPLDSAPFDSAPFDSAPFDSAQGRQGRQGRQGEGDHGWPEVFFTENETNYERVFGSSNAMPYVKDAFHRRVIDNEVGAINPTAIGTKAAPYYRLRLEPGESAVIRVRWGAEAEAPKDSFAGFDDVFRERQREADEFYGEVLPPQLTPNEKQVARQAYAGLLWSKQFYHYVVADWLNGDPTQPPPPAERRQGRNRQWTHLFSRDVLSMPDKWEYPWFAAWDLAFHMIPMACVDPDFAKQQLVLLLREWYMHPNGQLAAYEFAFGDVNPPVHAWAAWRVYKIAGRGQERDRRFLESVFQKLLLNFTWWVNRKDNEGNNLFSGGFLGLDNIGVFDRSKELPGGGFLQQADGTAWMAFYCATMLSMALELAQDHEVRVGYEDMASKFLEHFIQISDAMNNLGGTGLWDESDGFYYDHLQTDHELLTLRTRSLVGLMPLIAVEVLQEEQIERLPGFRKRLKWFLEHRKDLGLHMTHCDKADGKRLLAIPNRHRLERVLTYMLSEAEFLSPYGIRSLSKFHQQHPFELQAGGAMHRVNYEPGESRSGVFGGNSNWRGPVWFPINYLLIEALERYHYFYGDQLTVEFPTGSGKRMNLDRVAGELAARLSGLFLPDERGRRACHGDDARFASDPNWRDLVLFYEYFHGETGRGLGANHQTGWTALVTRNLEGVAARRTSV